MSGRGWWQAVWIRAEFRTYGPGDEVEGELDCDLNAVDGVDPLPVYGTAYPSQECHPEGAIAEAGPEIRGTRLGAGIGSVGKLLQVGIIVLIRVCVRESI